MDETTGLVLPDITTIPQRLHEFAWLPLSVGVEICPLLKDADGHTKLALLRYAAGASVPEHMHTGMEYIQILAGAQHDEHGAYAVNTLLVSRPGTRHQIASPEGCVALAIWEAPVRFV
jgi:anti-sigma factor ChrR (cupin superfamily)